jgi:hypothetical protein
MTVSFGDLFRLYARSHFYYAYELLGLVLLYLFFTEQPGCTLPHDCLMVASWLPHDCLMIAQ